MNRFAVGDEVYGMPTFPRPAATYAEFATLTAAGRVDPAPRRPGSWPENPAP